MTSMLFMTNPLVWCALLVIAFTSWCTVAAVPFNTVAPLTPTAAGVLDASGLNITSLSANDFLIYADNSIKELRLQANLLTGLPVGWLTAPSLRKLQRVDLSGNNFSAPGSIPTLAFINASISVALIMRQAALRTNSLVPGCFDQSTIVSIDLHNDFEVHAPQRNLFDPFPAGIIRGGFPLSLKSVWIGDTSSFAQSSFDWHGRDKVTPASINLIVDFAQGSAAATQLLRALPNDMNKPLTYLTVEVRGSLFSSNDSRESIAATRRNLTFNSEAGLNLREVTLPVHTQFLQPSFYSSFPFLMSITLKAPISLLTGASEWETTLPNVLPSIRLSDIPSMISFEVDVRNTPTNHQTPFSTLAGRYFAGLSGDSIRIKLQHGGFTTYPDDLFHGLNQVGILGMNMSLLYGPRVTIPIGFFPYSWREPSLDFSGIDSAEWLGYMDMLRYGFSTPSGRAFFLMADGVPRSCPAGSFGKMLSFNDNVPFCASCPPGHHCPERFGGALEPVQVLCPVGTWNSQAGQASCTPCPSGTWSDQVGATQSSTCTSCPIGFFSPQPGATSASACIPCMPGSFSSSPGTSTCALCETGTYGTSEGATSCNKCAVGRHSNITGAVSIATCEECEPGTFSSTPGVAECFACAPGSFQTTRGMSECSSCPAGTFLAFSGATSIYECMTCPGDRPNSLPGSKSLESCSAMILTAALHATIPCRTAPGYITDTTTGACNVPCALGSYCQSGNMIPCPLGTYADKPASPTCTSCPIGRFSTALGASSSTTCQPCPMGTFSSIPGASSCSVCPSGTVGPSLGATTLSECVSTPCATGSVICTAGATEPVHLNATHLLQSQYTLRPNDGALTWLEVRPVSSATSVATRDHSLRIATPSTIDQTSFDPLGGQASLLSDNVRLTLLICFGAVALAIIVRFVYVPRRSVRAVDVFSLAGPVQIGASPRKEPSQFGAAVSIAFFLCAVLVTVLLCTEDNEQTQTRMMSRTMFPQSGTATTAFEYVVHAHTSVHENTRLCESHTWLHTSVAGLSRPVSVRATANGALCEIVIECHERCGVIGRAELALVVPWQYQLLEYELSSDDARGIRASLTGVVGGVDNILLLGDTAISFSLTECFEIHRNRQSSTQSKQLPGSGYYFEFASASHSTNNRKSIVIDDQSAIFSVQLNVNDLVLVTSTEPLRTNLQLASSIVSLVVSLFSIFAVLYAVGRRVLGRCSISHGDLSTLDHPCKVHPSGEAYQTDSSVVRVSDEGQIV